MIMIQEQPPPNTLELHIMFSSLFVLYSILLRIPKRCYRIYLVSFQLHMIIKILLKQKKKLKHLKGLIYFSDGDGIFPNERDNLKKLRNLTVV